MEREIKSFLSGYSYLQPEKSCSQPGNFPGSWLLSTSLLDRIAFIFKKQQMHMNKLQTVVEYSVVKLFVFFPRGDF